MARWLTKVLKRVRELALQRRLRLTAKASREVAALGLDPEDVRDVLMRLEWIDSTGRKLSHVTGEWMYIFKRHAGRDRLYIKLILRSESVVVSFHQDEEDGHEQDH
jgi:tetrahydromethanopterin S-methyltransferase subunit G